MIIDKTGTITEGKPSVEKVGALKGFSEEEVLQYIVSLNQNSEHPLAEATVKYGNEKNFNSEASALKTTDFNSVTETPPETALRRGFLVWRARHRGTGGLPNVLRNLEY